MTSSFWVETLGCPKNKVDSEKLVGRLGMQGLVQADDVRNADLVVVNTCAFIEAARTESIETALDLVDLKKPDAKVVLTGCMAERYGAELARELPEVDLVAGFGQELVMESWNLTSTAVPVVLTSKPRGSIPVNEFDLLNLARPSSSSPWAYLKVAEGCNRACGFCAIPSFRGKQESRSIEAIVEEAQGLGVRELILIAQDLASYGTDLYGSKKLSELVESLSGVVDRLRLLYIYPSELNSGLIEAILSTGLAYFDLSLQHASRPLLRKMRRWGSGEKFLERIAYIRSIEPSSVFRSSFIIGYPGETEEDHDQLLHFIEEAQLDWAGFFTFSDEDGTFANGLGGKVDQALMLERLSEVTELQDSITARKRGELIGKGTLALVDEPGVARSFREAPEIDGIIRIDRNVIPGTFVNVFVVDSEGPDLIGEVTG